MYHIITSIHLSLHIVEQGVIIEVTVELINDIIGRIGQSIVVKFAYDLVEPFHVPSPYAFTD